MSENIIQYVVAASKGDTDAMAKLYSKTLKASYFLAETLCGDKQEAIQTTKKAYARAFCNIEKLKKPEAFEIWMKQNVAAAYRENHKFIFADADAGAVENSAEFLPENVLEDEELSAKVIAAVTNLRPELKTALVLYYNNGMPVQVLAKFLGVSESTANAILSKAKSSVIAESGIEAPEASSNALPVMTRLFIRKAADVSIDGTAVRDIFIFAINAYIAANPVQEKVEEPAEEVQEKADENTAEETADTEKEGSADKTVALDEEPKEKTPDNVISFKDRINSILDSAPAAAATSEPVSEKAKEDAPAFEDISSIEIPAAPVAPEIKVNASTSSDLSRDESNGISFAKPKTNAPVKTVSPTTPVKAEKKNIDIAALLKKLDPKMIIIAAVAVLLVIIIAFVGIFAFFGSSGNNEDVKPSDVVTNFVPGGFSECVEIEYFNEDVAVFKSATTGMYGLMNYRGEVVLEPVYEGFGRCSDGREYDDKDDSYHSYLISNGNQFEFEILNNQVTISDEIHRTHSIPTQTLEDTSYDERDRYFEGYAAARKGDKWGYISQETDKKVINYKYEAVNELEAGETAACDYCRPVTDGYIAVKKDGKMGIINLDDDVVVDFEYSNILPGDNGVFIACKEGAWGVILIGEENQNFKVNFKINASASNEPGISEESIGKYKVTNDGGINVRSDAGGDFDKVGELEYGDIITALESKEADNGVDWVRFKFKKADGTTVDGWVSTKMVESVD